MYFSVLKGHDVKNLIGLIGKHWYGIHKVKRFDGGEKPEHFCFDQWGPPQILIILIKVLLFTVSYINIIIMKYA